MKIMMPEFKSNRFTCPYCKTLAQQSWDKMAIHYDELNTESYFLSKTIRDSEDTISISTCHSCKKYHVWINDELIIPETTPLPLPSEDMPQNVKEIYLEAMSVFPKSVKASSALLRLGLQHLLKELGEEGKNINKDIGELVKKGLEPRVQQALDIVRITGNNAVHPGMLDLEDNRDIAFELFILINFIVKETITRPKELDELFNQMPEKALAGIQNRDK